MNEHDDPALDRPLSKCSHAELGGWLIEAAAEVSIHAAAFRNALGVIHEAAELLEQDCAEEASAVLGAALAAVGVDVVKN